MKCRLDANTVKEAYPYRGGEAGYGPSYALRKLLNTACLPWDELIGARQVLGG